MRVASFFSCVVGSIFTPGRFMAAVKSFPAGVCAPKPSFCRWRCNGRCFGFFGTEKVTRLDAWRARKATISQVLGGLPTKPRALIPRMGLAQGKAEGASLPQRKTGTMAWHWELGSFRITGYAHKNYCTALSHTLDADLHTSDIAVTVQRELQILCWFVAQIATSLRHSFCLCVLLNYKYIYIYICSSLILVATLLSVTVYGFRWQVHVSTKQIAQTWSKISGLRRAAAVGQAFCKETDRLRRHNSGIIIFMFGIARRCSSKNSHDFQPKNIDVHCIYICVYIYKRMYTYMHAYIYICMYVCI